MKIANPIYDTVFKFLMEDTESAIILLSTILGEEIEELWCLPQENTTRMERHSLTVYHLDFCAKIKTDKGYKQILIEIQKAKFAADIMRFRRYLGEQYSKKSNTYTVTENGQEVTKALPIITIYLLGYSLVEEQIPVLKVNRHLYDISTGKELFKKIDFIEGLTHDCFVIQISQLREDHQTELEKLLAVFDQKHIAAGDHQILNIDEDTYPEKYRPLIRRLQKAIVDDDIRSTMNIEDEILEELQNLERHIEKQGKTIEEKDKALEEKDKALEEKEKVLEEKDKVLEEKDKVLEEKDKVLDEQTKRLREQQRLIEKLKKQLNQPD